MENEKKGQLFTHLCTITTNKHAASHMLHVWTAFQLAIHDMEHLVHEQYSNCSIPISLYILCWGGIPDTQGVVFLHTCAFVHSQHAGTFQVHPAE